MEGTSVEDRLLAGGVVGGYVKQVVGGTGFQVAKLVDKGLAGHPREERADDVYVDDVREGVASLGEPTDVILQGLAGLLLTALEVPGVPRSNVRPLEIPDEDPLEVRQSWMLSCGRNSSHAQTCSPTQMGRY